MGLERGLAGEEIFFGELRWRKRHGSLQGARNCGNSRN
jgi:hypothetical protein